MPTQIMPAQVMSAQVMSAQIMSAQDPVRIDHAPNNVHWRKAHPRGVERVRAWIAAQDCEVVTGHGVLKARGGADMIVAYGPREVSVVRRDLFERTYKAIGGGVFAKRTDVDVRYFVLDRPAIVQTLEGEQQAKPGDWIVEGVEGELWPVSAKAAKRKYRRR